MASRQYEDAALRRVLAIALDSASIKAPTDPPTYVLSELGKELLDEQGGSGPVYITRDNLDRIFVARLFEAPADRYPQAPFQYLLGCYSRALQEMRAASPSRDPVVAQEVQAALFAAKDLIVSYAALVLTGGMIAQSAAAEARGPLQLLDSILVREGASLPGVVPTPPGFLEEFGAKHEGDSLPQVAGPVVTSLAQRILSTSPLGDYAPPLAALRYLLSVEPVARCLVALPNWLPNLHSGTGRAVQLAGVSWLGPFFSISCLPDQYLRQTPSIGDSCFSDASSRPQNEIVKSVQGLRMANKQIYQELHGLVKTLLGKGTRDAMIAWLANAIEHNQERSKMQVDMAKAASNGFFINLNAVLLRLCSPFMDPSNAAFWKRVDVGFVTDPAARISFKDDTKLAATSEEEGRLMERRRSSEGGSSSAPSPRNGGGGASNYHFICECFFMTAKALHLGVIKCFQDAQDDMRRLQDATRIQQELEAALPQLAGTREEADTKRKLANVKAYINQANESRLCFETQLMDPELLQEVVAFYRLLASWMLHLVCPGGQPCMPLPEAVPPQFATLPEYFVEDMADLLLVISRVQPQTLASARLEELMLFLVVFMGSPRYVRSPYLRSKLSEVLHQWLPPAQDSPSFKRQQYRTIGNSLTYLFESHPLVLQHLVPSLLQLYAAIEYTDRANQFYHKFHSRQCIGDILHYLWDIPAHRQAWKDFAAREGHGTGEYLRFCNMLINDSIYLLDESMKKLKDMREVEQLIADGPAWAALPPTERSERESQLQQNGDHLRSLLYLSAGVTQTMHLCTTEVAAPFLLPEMADRIAAMLNYFLLYLTGSNRRSLKIQDPEKYEFKPKELVTRICQIYLHIAAADSVGVFSVAIAGDARSYREEMFPEAVRVLRQYGLMPEYEIQALEGLAQRVQAAARDLEAEEALLEDVPDEFLDPIMFTLIRDPVSVPTSNVVYDRASISRHLLTDQRDPNNRLPLTQDQLQPNPEFAARIEAWLSEQRAKLRSKKAQQAQQAQQQQQQQQQQAGMEIAGSL